jgi:Transposase DDE domain
MAQSFVHDALAHIYVTLAQVDHRVQRLRIWPPDALLETLLMLVGGRSSKSSAGVLKAFAERGVELDEDVDAIPSRSGFCQARGKLPADSLLTIFRALSSFARPRLGGQHLVFGLLAVALDGTHVLMPRDPSTEEAFGCPKGGTKGGRHHYPQGLLVMASEIGTRLPLAADLLAWDGSEHAGARSILPSLGKGTVAIMDRGFVGKKLLGEIIASGAEVIVRMGVSEANSWDCVYHFRRSKAKEAIVTLALPKPGGGTCEVRVRLIRRAFRVGRPRKGQKAETMVLLTTLTDDKAAPREEIIDLYTQRWSIETAFREMKTVLNLERFHARKAEHVRQEIAAALIWMALVAVVHHEVEVVMTKTRGPQSWNDPRRWQINRTLLMELMDDLASTIIRSGIDPDTLDKLLARAAKYLVRTAQKRRPDRTNPRKRLAPHGRFRNGG